MQQKKFEELFEGYLRNELSASEQHQMMEMIVQHSQDDFLKGKIEMMLRENLSSELLDKEKSDYILNEILSHSDEAQEVITLQPQRKNRKKVVRVLFAAAGIIALIAISNSLFFQTNTPNQVPVVVQPVLANSLVDFSGKQLVRLPDGSTVLLNDNSSLKYNQASFNGKTREVTLIGEAFFDIKRNEEKPFIVHTGKVQTRVLGTAFNIKAGNSSDNIEVTVARGKVQVGDAQKIYGVITPNEQIKVNKTTLVFKQQIVSAAIVTEWKSNYLILDDINMEEAAMLIAQKYKVQIALANDKIKKCRITASFLNEEDLDHVLKVICSVIETEYRYNKDGNVIIDGKGCE